MTGGPDAQGWLEGFAERVRERDLDGGRAWFAVECTSFGTRVERADGLDDLVAHQWAPIWTSTRGFRFLPGTVRVESSDDGTLHVAIAQWESEGVAPDGSTFPRRGRATIALRAEPGAPSGLVATHSHFSEPPAVVEG